MAAIGIGAKNAAAGTTFRRTDTAPLKRAIIYISSKLDNSKPGRVEAWSTLNRYDCGRQITSIDVRCG